MAKFEEPHAVVVGRDAEGQHTREIDRRADDESGVDPGLPPVRDQLVGPPPVAADRKVYALDAATGTSRWIHITGGAVLSSPAVVDGTVYIGSDDRKVYALDAATGRGSAS
ncbi:outer membrane protein assembly factor BamB family protein [Streptomyces goshikiensis]